MLHNCVTIIIVSLLQVSTSLFVLFCIITQLYTNNTVCPRFSDYLRIKHTYKAHLKNTCTDTFCHQKKKKEKKEFVRNRITSNIYHYQQGYYATKYELKKPQNDLFHVVAHPGVNLEGKYEVYITEESSYCYIRKLQSYSIYSPWVIFLCPQINNGCFKAMIISTLFYCQSIGEFVVIPYTSSPISSVVAMLSKVLCWTTKPTTIHHPNHFSTRLQISWLIQIQFWIACVQASNGVKGPCFTFLCLYRETVKMLVYKLLGQLNNNQNQTILSKLRIINANTAQTSIKR